MPANFQVQIIEIFEHYEKHNSKEEIKKRIRELKRKGGSKNRGFSILEIRPPRHPQNILKDTYPISFSIHPRLKRRGFRL